MKLALIFYYSKPNRFSFNPLAGALEQAGVFPRILLYRPKDPVGLRRAVRTALRRHDRVVVGFSFATPQLGSVARLVARLREAFADRLFWVAGGPHPSADPEGALRLGFDLVVRGEGEEAFVEVLARLEAGADARGVAGTSAFDARGRYRKTAARPPVDLDRLPPFAPGRGLFGPIEITRGCPYACAFCQTAQLFGRRPRHRGPKAVAHWAGIMARRGLFDVRFISPDAFSYGSADGRTVELAAVRELLVMVRQAQGPAGRIFFGTMPSEVRPDHVSPAALRLVREYATNDNLVIGAQSGSQRVLDAAGRGHSVADILSAVKATAKAGFTANVDFIFGLPGETGADLERTVVLMRRLVAMGARIHAHSFVPLPQTRYAALPRGAMPERFGADLARMAAAGVLYGQWRAQEHLARRLAGQPDLAAGR